MSTTADRRRIARSLPPLADEDAAAIERFLDAARAEQGLSPAALSAYRSDLSSSLAKTRIAAQFPTSTWTFTAFSYAEVGTWLRSQFSENFIVSLP